MTEPTFNTVLITEVTPIKPTVKSGSIVLGNKALPIVKSKALIISAKAPFPLVVNIEKTAPSRGRAVY